MNEILNQICAVLEQDGKQLLDEGPLVEFQRNVRNMQANFSEILEEGRVLHLGVVGEVKAGKSSFLNALLFEGEDVLPKAPTPMTAALTKLSYSEHPAAKIVFYSRDDWRGIERMARRYDEKLNEMYSAYCREFQEEQQRKNRMGAVLSQTIRHNQSASGQQSVRPPEKRMDGQPVKQPKSIEDFERLRQEEMPSDWKACKEVCRLAQAGGVDIYRYLGQELVIPQEGSSNEYLHRLSDYVGSEGAYTPIVKYTEIQLNNPTLRGVEVVDTPGLNDPVISRSKKTKEFLIKCDAVFLLSYCGQFLGAEDIDFIMSTLPDEGIQKAVLIGSKMDSAILQYHQRNATFRQAYLGTKHNCDQQAEKNIGDCKRNARGSRTVDQIERSLPPIYTSSMAYSAAVKQSKGQPLSAEEMHLLENFHRRFSDFEDSLLMGLSSIEDARKEAFEGTIAQREAILQERAQTFFTSQKARFLKDLEDIYARAATSKSDLENFDCAQDEAQLKDMRSRLDTARVEVKGAFESAAVTAREAINDMAVEAMDEMNNHLRIEVATDKETVHHSDTSGHLWWKKTDHWDEIITTHSAEVRDAEENLRKYSTSCLRMVNTGFKHMIKIDDVKERVKSAIMKAFEQHDQNFDEQRILVPLDNALRRIILPNISLKLSKYTDMLDGKLSGMVTSGTVRNEDIPELKRAQDQVLAAMSEDIAEEIKAQGNKITDLLNEQAGLFIDGLVGELEENHKRLEKQIENKRENLQRYETLLENLRSAKQSLQAAGAESILKQ